MKRMLVTSDGSPESEAVIPVARDLASATGAEVHLLRVVHVPGATRMGRVPMMQRGSPGFSEPLTMASAHDTAERVVEDRDQAIERVEFEAMHDLQQLAKSFEPGQAHCHVRFDRGTERPLGRRRAAKDDPANVIIEVAKELEVDLIAMATHGRGAIGSVVQGSVAAKVIHAGVAPVLLARPSALRV